MSAKRKPKGKPMKPEALRAELAALDLSQAAIADEWGVSRELVCRWANGAVPIPGWVRYALAGVPVLRERRASKVTKVDSPKPIESPAEPANVVRWSGLKSR
jgi:hypothetical protein